MVLPRGTTCKSALPLRLKHLPRQYLGKIVCRRLCVGLPGGGQRAPCGGGNRCGRQKVQFRIHRITILRSGKRTGKYRITSNIHAQKIRHILKIQVREWQVFHILNRANISRAAIAWVV
jgi:hypothetical protein